MDEAAIRQLVRAAIQRHLRAPGEPVPSLQADPWTVHPSHGRFLTLAPGDGSCVVEPSVRCTHCGFCQSYGH